MDYGIQLGRRFRALKAWMVIRSFGREGLATRIREHIRLARLFASWLDADSQFQVLAPVTMAVVCFRIAPHMPGMTPERDQEINSFNQRLVEAINRTGKAYLTYTTLNGQLAMRLAVGNILTTERHLARVFDLIRRESAALRVAP